MAHLQMIFPATNLDLFHGFSSMLNNQMVIHPNVDGYITSWQTPS